MMLGASEKHTYQYAPNIVLRPLRCTDPFGNRLTFTSDAST